MTRAHIEVLTDTVRPRSALVHGETGAEMAGQVQTLYIAA